MFCRKVMAESEIKAYWGKVLSQTKFWSGLQVKIELINGLARIVNGHS